MTSADVNGRWVATLNGLRSGEAFTLTVKGKTDSVVLNDILVGDARVCLGQSNMEYQLTDQDEIQGPGDSQLRYLLVPKNTSLDAVDEIKNDAHWVAASPRMLAAFSAVSHYFGKSCDRKQEFRWG